MSTRIRPRTLAVLAAILGLMAVMVATIPSSSAEAPGFVRLNLGADGRYFEYGTVRQTLTTPKNGCQITSAEPLIGLSSTGNQSQPGLGPDGIGVKRSPSSGNGTPCTQVDTVETLTLKPSTAPNNPLTGKRFSGVRLDLEMTGNAVVKLTFSQGALSETYELQTGTSIEPDELAVADLNAPYVVDSDVDGDGKYACAAPNSSGPNSGSNDNCQWRVDGSFDFDTITLATTVGTVSLEGGGDFPSGSDFDSLFYLANSAPTAVDDSFTTDEDTTLAGDVTANDTDPDGDELTGVTLGTGPSNGDLTLDPDGTFTYVPDRDFNGSDSFTYTASDGTATSNAAVVSITVTPVNDPPVATGAGLDIDEEETGTVVVATDVDRDDVLTVDCDVPSGWTVQDLGGGAVEITPPTDFFGQITITCAVTDSAGATTESPVTIAVGVTNVNDAPVALDDAAEVNEDDFVIIPVLDNDTDVDGDALTVAGIGNISPLGATAVANADGTVTYTPPPAFTGAGSFTYQATDGTLTSASATVAVTVFPVICSNETVSDTEGDLTGAFTRLSDPLDCKRFELVASLEDDSILFQPSGDQNGIKYRGVLSLGSKPRPAAVPGDFSLLLRYDATGGFNFVPMQWCIDPQFDADQNVFDATLPGTETWCIASAYVEADSVGDLETVWQIFGIDDPRVPR